MATYYCPLPINGLSGSATVYCLTTHTHINAHTNERIEFVRQLIPYGRKEGNVFI